MMNTRSKTRAQTVSSNTSPVSNPKSQVNQVISQTNSSPPVTSLQDKRSPFSSPFARPQSFMRNVLSRVSNQNNVQFSSAPHTAPALIEQSQSSLSHSNERTIEMEPVSIKRGTPSPRKLSPTPEDYVRASDNSPSAPIAVSNLEVNQNRRESETITALHTPHSSTHK